MASYLFTCMGCGKLIRWMRASDPEEAIRCEPCQQDYDAQNAAAWTPPPEPTPGPDPATAHLAEGRVPARDFPEPVTPPRAYPIPADPRILHRGQVSEWAGSATEGMRDPPRPATEEEMRPGVAAPHAEDTPEGGARGGGREPFFVDDLATPPGPITTNPADFQLAPPPAPPPAHEVKAEQERREAVERGKDRSLPEPPPEDAYGRVIPDPQPEAEAPKADDVQPRRPVRGRERTGKTDRDAARDPA